MKYFLLLLLVPFSAYSQCRYFDRIFNDVGKTSNVIYGNAPALTAIYFGEQFTNPQDLRLDIYQPLGDIEPKRALIIFAHSGGFLNGSKDNEDMQALSDTFAHYGYVTASMGYRKNFNILSSNSSERAVWRGTQDASAAVRFFKENASLYNIDTTKIFFWGSSAGAFMALGLAYVDDAERPASTSSSPNLGCKDCTGNNFVHSSKVAGVISCWGATKDTSWIRDNNNIPVQLFHGSADNTVPFSEGYPFGLATVSYVRGSLQLNEQLNRTSIYHEFYPAPDQPHEYWGTSNGNFTAAGPTPFWPFIINKAKSFMTGRMGVIPSCGPLPLSLLSFTGRPNNNVVNLNWKTAAEYDLQKIIVERSPDGAQFTALAEVLPKGSNVTGADYMATDPYPFSGIGFYRLRIVDRNGSFNLSQVLRIWIPGKAISITQLYPNPVQDVLQLQVQSGKSQAVEFLVFDMTGKKLLAEQVNLAEGLNNAKIPFSRISSGVYILQCKSASGASLGSFKVTKN